MPLDPQAQALLEQMKMAGFYFTPDLTVARVREMAKERFPLLVCMEHFLHRGPPLAGRPRLQWRLHRLGPGPPLARPGVRSHFRHIGLIIVADIFKVRKEQFTVAKNAVVANVAHGNHRQHFGPNGGMQAFVCFDLVGLQPYNLSNPAQN